MEDEAAHLLLTCAQLKSWTCLRNAYAYSDQEKSCRLPNNISIFHSQAIDAAHYINYRNLFTLDLFRQHFNVQGLELSSPWEGNQPSTRNS